MANDDDVIVSWQDAYSVGVPLVDDQHKGLIDLTNRLYAACRKGKEFSQAVFLQTVRGAVDYVGYHFSTEERMMKRVNYPDYLVHKQQHEEFVRTVAREVDKFTSGKEFSPQDFVIFLKEWVLNHIACTDTRMGQYFLNLEKQGGFEGVSLQEIQDDASRT
ncbi:MAG: bacteriohemerythrin [Treponema sp.]|jgi:hemerythrin|nr:bacteriohemerythrin [Treponema sp.]